MIMASDGMWDVLTLSKAVKVARPLAAKAAATTLLECVTSQNRFNDDTSIIVVDVLPHGISSFPSAVSAASSPLDLASAGAKSSVGSAGSHLSSSPSMSRSKSSGGGMFACFRPELDESDSRDVTGFGRLAFFADVDCLRAYPEV